jgi:hypothetical protein
VMEGCAARTLAGIFSTCPGQPRGLRAAERQVLRFLRKHTRSARQSLKVRLAMSAGLAA